MNTLKEIVEQYGSKTTPTKLKVDTTIKRIRILIKDYIERNNLKSLVVGISGGLDSSVIAALCQEKYTGVPLIGISIPMSSSNAHTEQARWVGENYCTAFEEFNAWDDSFNFDASNEINLPAYEDISSRLSWTDGIAEKAGFKCAEFPTAVLQGNMKARLRMITLYDLARKTNGMVLSTDNQSEFQMGFWTICGDVGDYGPIQNIGKGFELPAIAEALGVREDIISQPPSDGLMVTEENTDEAQLGANYKEVDTIMGIYLGTMNVSTETMAWFKSKLFTMIGTDTEGAKKVANVISRYEALAYKRNGTINLSREEIGI